MCAAIGVIINDDDDDDDYHYGFCCQGGSRDRSICREMKCWVPQLGHCYAGVEQRAFEGTTCANLSWCIIGNCVYDDSAPQAPGQ